MLELHVGKVRLKDARHRLSPEARGLEHVRLVDRGHPAPPASGELPGFPGHPLDLGGGIAARVERLEPAARKRPAWADAPGSIRAQLADDGALMRDGQVTPDGFAINTSYTINSPHPASVTDKNLLVPEQTAPTIGDRLSDQNVSWAWYSGGWNTAVLGHAGPLFQFHHQPFAYYANFADGTPGRADHLKDEQDFYTDVVGGKLPAVTFIKPLGPDNEHPGYATLLTGQQHVADLVSTIQNSKYWSDTAIIITYDEHGGRWDHVAPPVIDKWGPGLRVPTIVISPFAKKGFVDHTQYDTTSILKLIEARWNLQPLGTRDAATGDLSTAFDFSQG